jgi:hypothetical protein
VWGEIYATALSSEFVWIATSSLLGVLQIDILTGEVKSLLKDEVVTSLFWVDSWGKLYAGSKDAVRTLDIENGQVTKKYHGWTGGIIDSEPLGFAYDGINDALWLAESNSVHKQTKDGVWWRMGLKQGSPTGNITSVTASNGFIWVGSAFGVSRIRGDAPVERSPRINSESSQSQTDPWTWAFLTGPRYIPANSVASIVGADSKANYLGLPTVALVVTSGGLSVIDSQMWTLKEKAVAMGSFQFPRHYRHGLSTGVSLRVYGDVDSYVQECDDNDGLWTSMHAMGEVYRYLVTGGLKSIYCMFEYEPRA